jgi:hypothetical protein
MVTPLEEQIARHNLCEPSATNPTSGRSLLKGIAQTQLGAGQERCGQASGPTCLAAGDPTIHSLLWVMTPTGKFPLPPLSVPSPRNTAVPSPAQLGHKARVAQVSDVPLPPDALARQTASTRPEAIFEYLHIAHARASCRTSGSTQRICKETHSARSFLDNCSVYLQIKTAPGEAMPAATARPEDATFTWTSRGCFPGPASPCNPSPDLAAHSTRTQQLRSPIPLLPYASPRNPQQSNTLQGVPEICTDLLATS